MRRFSLDGHAKRPTLTLLAAAALALVVVLVPAPAGSIALSVTSASEPVVGETTVFWAMDEGPMPAVTVQMQAVAKYVGERCVIYVGEQSPVNQTVLNNLGAIFDSTIYPRLTATLGPARVPGIDGASKITILIYDFHDQTTTGLFRPADTAPTFDDDHSNRREMIHLNSIAVSADPERGPAIAAHEFAHLLAFYHDYVLDSYPGRTVEARWINEGISCYAEHLAGYDGRTNSFLLSFTSDPGTSLTSDFSVGKDSLSNYGASYSFMSYLVGREGQDFFAALVAEPTDGIAGINAVLRARGSIDTFDSLFNDWVVAGFLDERSPQVAQYSFPDLAVQAHSLSQIGSYPLVGTGLVANFGAVYLDFPSTTPSAEFSVVVDGDDGAPLRAALISWDSTGTMAPDVRWLDFAQATASGTLSAPLGYDSHTLAVLARGTAGMDALYSFRFNGAADPPVGVQFLDLGGDSEFYPFVADLVARHVISGMQVPDGSGLWFFMGQSPVKRAQFAKMIMQATGLHTEAIEHPDDPSFKDVGLTHLPEGEPDPYPYDFVEEAASSGIVTGYKDGRFGPYDAITRGQLVTMIARGANAAGRPFPTYTGHDTVFADVTPANALYQYVMQAYRAGIFTGVKGSDGRQYFAPWSSATRNHVAKMTDKLIQYLEAPGG